MILAPIQDRTLRGLVRRAALPEEDVFHSFQDVRHALQFGFPRLLVCRAADHLECRDRLQLENRRVPIVVVAEDLLQSWDAAREVDGWAIRPVDDSALRLRSLLEETALPTEWVEAVFSDLTQILGESLPSELRGFSRRILEYPIRYSSLNSLAEAVGLSAGALRARFRRRGLPSPAVYHRWVRLLAAARILSDPQETTLTASFRLGFTSDGNFCRWVRATSGLTPSSIRDWNGRLLLLIRLAETCLPEGSLDQWESLDGMFLRQVA
jgi:AraC-like DNA-binding protein